MSRPDQKAPSAFTHTSKCLIGVDIIALAPQHNHSPNREIAEYQLSDKQRQASVQDVIAGFHAAGHNTLNLDYSTLKLSCTVFVHCITITTIGMGTALATPDNRDDQTD